MISVEPVVGVPANPDELARSLFCLSADQEDTKARWLLAGVVALTLLNSGVSVAFSYIGRDFWTALSNKDPEQFNVMLQRHVVCRAVRGRPPEPPAPCRSSASGVRKMPALCDPRESTQSYSGCLLVLLRAVRTEPPALPGYRPSSQTKSWRYWLRYLARAGPACEAPG